MPKAICPWPLLQVIEESLKRQVQLFTVLDNGNNAIVVTVGGEVYSVGVNGAHCPLGTGSTDIAISPIILPSISNKGNYIQT